MTEQEPSHLTPGPPMFGEPLPSPRRGKQAPVAPMFQDGEELPLFSGTPISAIEKPYVPEDKSLRQTVLPGIPELDYDHIYKKDKELRRRRRGAELPTGATLFQALPALQEQPEGSEQSHPVLELMRPYIDLDTLRRLAATGADIRAAIRHPTELPEEIAKLLETISLLLRPPEHYQIKSPADMAAYLMLDMGFLDQEQFKVACLDSKNHLQAVHLVYQGSVNASLIRVGEVFKEPIKLNSVAVIIAHNHPSSDPTPSPEDARVTTEIVAAGKLFDIDVLDHLVIGQGKWVSMREKGLGFTR